MNDIEDLLRRYEPAAPPQALRARVLAGARSGRRSNRILHWVPAAVAAGVAVAFYLLGAGPRASADAQFSVVQRERASLIDELTDSIGGDPLARLAAEDIVGSMTPPGPAQLLEETTALEINHD